MSLRPFTVRECGAGSLAAVLALLGEPVSPAELDAELPKAANGGVLSLDMVLAARARGFTAELVKGSGELVARLIAEGLPAILILRMVDAPGAKRDLYHYVVADWLDDGLMGGHQAIYRRTDADCPAGEIDKGQVRISTDGDPPLAVCQGERLDLGQPSGGPSCRRGR